MDTSVVRLAEVEESVARHGSSSRIQLRNSFVGNNRAEDWKRRDRELRQAPPTDPSSELNSFGYSPKNARLRLEQQALKGLVLPCLDALLALDGEGPV